MVVGPEEATLESPCAFAAAANGRRFSRGRSCHRAVGAPKEVIVFGWFVPLAQQSGGGSTGLLITLGLMFVVFYFLLIRPQQRRARAQKELMSGLDVGDEVVTIGGMYGTITDLDDSSVTVEVADGVEIKMRRNAIAGKVNEPVADDSDDEDEDDERRGRRAAGAGGVHLGLRGRRGARRAGPAMKSSGRLVTSLVVVGVLVAASISAFVVGIRPLLGLDLVGGVSVILEAPRGTDRDVMEKTVDSIRQRVDALGVAEPDISLVGGNLIQVQLPGLGGQGTVEQRGTSRWCVLNSAGVAVHCYKTKEAAEAAAKQLRCSGSWT